MKRKMTLLLVCAALAACGNDHGDYVRQGSVAPQQMQPVQSQMQPAPQQVIVQQQPQSSGMTEVLTGAAIGAMAMHMISGPSKTVVERRTEYDAGGSSHNSVPPSYASKPAPVQSAQVQPAQVKPVAPVPPVPATPVAKPPISYASVYKPTPSTTKSAPPVAGYKSYAPSTPSKPSISYSMASPSKSSSSRK